VAPEPSGERHPCVARWLHQHLGRIGAFGKHGPQTGQVLRRRTWPVQMDRPAHRRRLTWCAAQHAISMPRRTGLANSIRRLPGTVDLFSYRARQPAALPGRRTGPPSRRRWSSVPASASRRSSWAEGSDPRSLGVVNMLTVALCGRVVVQLRLACRPLSPLPP
jgi:hypothetical protein